MANLDSLGWMSGAGTLIGMWGALESGRAARIQGERAKAAAEFAAWQAEQQGNLAIAASQRQALEEQRKSRFEASRALALAAASGGGVSDPTIVNLLSNVRGEGVYRANVALYEGEARARQLRMEAASGRVSGATAVVEGLATEQAYGLSAAGTGIRGAASLYARYKGSKSGDSTLIDEWSP